MMGRRTLPPSPGPIAGFEDAVLIFRTVRQELWWLDSDTFAVRDIDPNRDHPVVFLDLEELRSMSGMASAWDASRRRQA